MAILKRIFSWRLAGLAGALLAVGGAIWCLWLFQRSGSIATRMAIPASEMTAAQGFAWNWRVPESLRARRWQRAEVRVWEDAKPLPFRVEDFKLVADEGKGRFGIEQDSLCFSASDNSSPSANGRNYAAEIRWPDYKPAIWAAVCLGVAMVLGLLALPRRVWIWLAADLAKPVAGQARLFRRSAIVLAALAAFCLVQAWTPARIVAHERLAPGAFVHETGNEFFYRLPRWVRHQNRVRSATLWEDQKPLQQIDSWAWPSAGAGGSYYCSPWRICFRATDGSNPALNGRTYVLTALVFPPEEALGLAVFLAGLSLILFAYGRELASACRGGQYLRRTGWWWAMAGVGLVKLWVVAGDEVLSDEADAYGYAASAVALVWQGTDAMPTHPSGFPIIAGMVAQLGVPWRLALEILYLGAAAGLAAVMASLTRSRWVAMLLFMAMAWHPWTLSGFHNFMADPTVLVLSVALLAAMLRVLSLPSVQWNWRVFLGIGALLFLWEWSRTEDPLVYGTYALFALLAWRLAGREADPAPRRDRLARLALPLLMVLALGSGVRLINYSQFGMYAKSFTCAPGLMALMRALYRIQPEREVRYAVVTRQTLQAACRASPTLGLFEQRLLDPQASATRAGAMGTKSAGEFGSWLNWLLTQSLPEDPRAANAAMLKAANEINAALAAGRLPRRVAFFPLDPNWRLWLPDLLPCFVHSLRGGVSLRPSSPEWIVSDRPVVNRTFDAAANRRASGADPNLLLGEGTIQSAAGALDSVAVTDKNGKLLGASLLTTNAWTGAVVFRLRAPLPENPGGCGLFFFQAGKLRLTDPVRGVRSWTNTVALPDTGENITYSCSFRVAESPSLGRLRIWERKTEAFGKGLAWAAVLVTFIAVFFSRVCEEERFRRVLAGLILAAGWLVARAALYGLLEANTGWVVERYMHCVSPVFVLILCLATVVAASFIRKRMRRNPGPRPNPADANFEPR
jgi:hypothetical protein